MAHSSHAQKTLFINAQIYSGTNQSLKADGFIVEHGRFGAIGLSEELTKRDPAIKVIDLKNGLVMPGFIESHAHLLGIGQSKITLDLKGLGTSKIVDMVMAQAKKQAKGTWIKGRGWDQNLWPDKQFPNKDLLKHIEHPVYLRRVDGHAVWINERALSLSGITDSTKDPSGGQIIRDNQGRATGVLVDNAMELINKHLDKPKREDLELYLDLATKEALAVGITSFHDAGVSGDVLALYEDYANHNKLKLRIYAMVDGDDQKLVERFFHRGPVFINDVLTIRSIKLFADGALGSRGAALLENYHDQPGHFGLLLITEKELEMRTKQALKAGFQVATHAIGDKANRLVLNAYESALHATKVRDARLRIEHAQLVDPDDLPRFKKLSVIASMQPIHCTSDMAWVPERLGHARIHNRAYPWRSLLNHGAILAFGSDGPVEDINPILSVFAAVSRSNKDGFPINGFMPEQKLKLKEALNGYHSAAAFAEFNEHQKGQIKEGYLADFVVFDEDLLHPHKSSFLAAKPKMTAVGGEIVFQR